MISATGCGALCPAAGYEEIERAMEGTGESRRACSGVQDVDRHAGGFVLLALVAAACGSSTHSASGVKVEARSKPRRSNTSGNDPFTGPRSAKTRRA